MGRTVCTEPQCLYKCDLYHYLIPYFKSLLFTWQEYYYMRTGVVKEHSVGITVTQVLYKEEIQ
jgi:hypothetical protein